jgi:hypothetical protein
VVVLEALVLVLVAEKELLHLHNIEAAAQRATNAVVMSKFTWTIVHVGSSGKSLGKSRAVGSANDDIFLSPCLLLRENNSRNLSFYSIIKTNIN